MIKIITCPVCKKKGEAHIYKVGESPPGIVVHKTHVEMGFFRKVDEMCYLTDKQARKIENESND